MSKPKPKRYAVYQLKSPAGELLYIGYTTNPEKRRKEHQRVFVWALDCTMTYEWVGGLKRARLVEKRQIKKLKPKHNIMHSVVVHDVNVLPYEEAARVWLTNPNLPTREVLAMMPGWYITLAYECFGPRHRVTDEGLSYRVRENIQLRNRLLAEAGLK